jgi:hypothetical protein
MPLYEFAAQVLNVANVAVAQAARRARQPPVRL